jgi:hypothetical protein
MCPKIRKSTIFAKYFGRKQALGYFYSRDVETAALPVKNFVSLCTLCAFALQCGPVARKFATVMNLHARFWLPHGHTQDASSLCFDGRRRVNKLGGSKNSQILVLITGERRGDLEHQLSSFQRVIIQTLTVGARYSFPARARQARRGEAVIGRAPRLALLRSD